MPSDGACLRNPSTAPPCQKDHLDEEGGRTAGRESNQVKFDWLSGDGRIIERRHFYFDLEVEGDVFLRLTGRAHPRAEGGGMRGSFVMGMMRGMRDRLWIHQPAQDEQAES